MIERKYANSFTINPEFLAGLNEYGYELILVKKGSNEPIIFTDDVSWEDTERGKK